MTTEYIVHGMSCGHCVKSISDELTGLAGVTGVEVDLATGKVSVSADSQVSDEAIRAAIDEAGYQVVG